MASGVGRTLITASMDGVSVSTTLVLIGWAQVDAGYSASCGLTSDGRLYCWGPSAAALFGDAPASTCFESECYPTPVAVSPGMRFSSVSVSGAHACALDMNGAAWCWGNNHNGELGDGSLETRTTPTRVLGNHTFVQVAAGRNATCAREANGHVWCWGQQVAGQVGNGVIVMGGVLQPSAVQAGPFDQIVTGGTGVCGVAPDGLLACWGNLYDYSDGVWVWAKGTALPTPWGAPHAFKRIAIGEIPDYCGITLTDEMFCWGHNDRGQLGTGSTAPTESPTRISLPFTPTPDRSGLEFHLRSFRQRRSMVLGRKQLRGTWPLDERDLSGRRLPVQYVPWARRGQ